MVEHTVTGRPELTHTPQPFTHPQWQLEQERKLREERRQQLAEQQRAARTAVQLYRCSLSFGVPPWYEYSLPGSS